MVGTFVARIVTWAVAVSVGTAVAFVRGIAFWTAVALPVYCLVLLVSGSPTLTNVGVVGRIIAVNVVALVVGHGYSGALREEIALLR